MATLNELQSLLGEVLDSTASFVQGRTRGGADGSTIWVDVVNGDRVQARAFGSITPGTCGVIQDRAGQWWAIGQGQGAAETQSVQFYRRRVTPIVKKETPDVAVVLGCEKDDRYDLWLTYLGDDRRNQFAFLGSFPRKLQTDQYWAWESGIDGRFEFNPYTGATGGFGGLVQGLTNYDGAIVEVGPQGAFYQSEGWIGGGDKGGIVTPIWSRVLTDYEVHASTYLQTLCQPLSTYTDVSWEWSDGGGGLYKVPGGGATGSASDKETGKTWVVNWSYEGGGGSVNLVQEPAPRVTTRSPQDGNTYVLITASGQRFESSSPFSVSRDSRRKPAEQFEGVSAYFEFCWGRVSTAIQTTPELILPTAPYTVGSPPNPSYYYAYYLFGSNWADQPLDIGGFVIQSPNCGYNVDMSFTWSSPGVSLVFEDQDGNEFDPEEHLLEISTGGETVYSSGWGEREGDPTQETIPPPPSYTIQVFNEDGIEVATDSAGSPISSTTDEIVEMVLGVYIQGADGQNLGGQYEEGNTIPAGFSVGDDIPHKFRRYTKGDGLTAEVEAMDIYAQISAWVEVVEKELARVEINGKDGQDILDSSAYEIATRPYTGPDGKTVYPCYPQRSGADPKEESRKFQASDGFNAYHITWYNARDENGSIVETVYFDFNNPDLSGFLPSPSINYDYSLVSTDLNLSFDLKAWASYGKDVPEEDPETGETTNLDEEKIGKTDPVGVVTVAAMGFIYGLYGPTKVSQIINQTIDAERKNEDGSITRQTLGGNYDITLWNFRNRARKPRSYLLSPDVFDEGEPFEEFDINDFNQRGLSQIPRTMSDSFRTALWGYEMAPINNEKLEDWRWERATFDENPQGGATPNQRRFFDDPFFNSSNVRQSGEKRVDIRVKEEEIEALLFWKKSNPVKKNVTFLIYPESGEGEPTEKTFKLNPIKDVFEGYSDVKVLSAAAILY